ncbi:uncharacterized protein LOC123529478 isoform X1 [Mercenaria mercenaria]|uniref:uncharacterized protein LOC123529478 isoform X1 n=1 Tax=Mercenaria mercenaria TaxID=6596 RepID=UPI00234E75D4|nr:uncharacterized protein LOC123529478 isoform X1 [Mercenaria mercenaria]
MASLNKRRKMKGSLRTLEAKKLLLKHKRVICTAIEELNADALLLFCFLRIINCNGAFPVCFSDAWCKTLRSIEDPEEKNQQIALFSDLFEISLIQMLLEDSDKVDDTVISDGRLTAVKRLIDFMDEIDAVQKIVEDQEKLTDEPMKESEWAAILGNHVLKKLAVSREMVIDISYPERHIRCPCGCKNQITIGDCSFGNRSVWHGSVDILIGRVAVATTKETAEDDFDDEIYTSAFEDSRNQIVAEAIAFSFTLNKGLVPTIAISKETFKIFMYHPEHDLLFEGSELKFYVKQPLLPRKQKKLDTRSIFALWLAINYDFFCSGVSQDHKDFGYTADFKSHVKDSIKIYKESMNFGNCRHGKSSELPYKAVKGKWRRCHSSAAADASD